MDNSKKNNDASKMQRILSNHCLQGLVFQKRERKQAQNPLSTTYASLNKKQIKKSVAAPKKKENNIIEKPNSNKKQAKAKKIEKYEDDEIEEQKSGYKRRKNDYLKQAQQNDKAHQVQDKVIKKKGRPKKINIPAKVDQNQRDEQNLEQIIQQPVLTQKYNAIKSQILAEKIEEKEEAQIDNEIEPVLKQKKQNLVKESKKNEIEQANKSNSQSYERVNEKLEQDMINQSSQEKELVIDQMDKNIEQQWNSQKQQEENERNGQRTLRKRKTKGQALKRFSYLNDFSDEKDYDDACYSQRKKKRSGNTQGNYGYYNSRSQRASQINRIFRKTAKASLAAFSLHVNINQINFRQFTTKFGVFDMVHFSLPMDILVNLRNINQVIPKGFIFIWAEKKQIPLGYHLMNRWGFDVIDQIMWIKTNEEYKQLVGDKDKDAIFQNCRTTCLVGYKCSATQKTEYCTKISNNIIFAEDNECSFEKPDQIYEIGDLMMPGAKKLQIGMKKMGGWLSLIHQQKSLKRCHQCLKRYEKGQLFLIFEQNHNSCLCEQCLIQKYHKNILLKDQVEILEDNKQEDQMKIQNSEQPYKIKQIIIRQNPNIRSLTFEISTSKENPTCFFCFKNASHTTQLLKYQQLQKEAQKLSCLDCFRIENSNQGELSVIYRKQYYFPLKYVDCGSCGKNTLNRSYYECSSCKENHNVCSECFWLNSRRLGSQQLQNHEWKFRPIIESPENKITCFTCHQDCNLPIWGCQTCQGWYWCGNCDKSKIPPTQQHHCHYFQDHHCYLII